MLQYSPKIVQDSLVMCLDASQNKSYPTDLPVKNGLLVWLDAADDSTFSYSSGTEVSQWRDKSGNNFHANQATVAYQPGRTSVNNGRKSINFIAGNFDYLTITSGISVPNDVSIFIIYKPTTQTNQYAVLIDNYHAAVTYTGFVIQRNSNASTFYYANGNGSAYLDTASSQWSYTDNVIGILSLNKSSSTATPYANGTAQSSSTVNAAIVQSTTGLVIGSLASGASRFYNGDMCEILIFNRSLSSTEMKQVHTYLGQKWGISNTDRSFIDLANTSNYFYAGTNLPRFDYYNKGSFVGSSTSNSFFQSQNLNVDFNKDWTVSIWFKHKNPSDWDFLMDYAQGGGGTLLTVYSGQLRWNYGAWFTDSVTDSPTARTYLVRDTIYNAVFQKSGTTLKTFLNGASYGSPTTNSQTLTANSTLRFGVGPSVGTDSFTGNIYACNVYSRALSATEVAQNYEAQKSKFANTIVQQGLVLNLDAGNPYSYGGAGTTFYDVSPTALSWTINNATYNSSDPKYFSYNGSDSWLQSSTSAAYDSQTITMECWCYPNSLSQNGFLFEKGQVNTQYSMFFENANFVFRTMGSVSNQSSTFSPSTYLTVSAWNHIVCTYNGSSKIMYVNGIQVQSVAASGALPTGQTDQYIGRHSSGYFFNGRIGETRVYNIALSAAQVLQNYNATKGRFGL